MGKTICDGEWGSRRKRCRSKELPGAWVSRHFEQDWLDGAAFKTWWAAQAGQASPILTSGFCSPSYDPKLVTPTLPCRPGEGQAAG